MGGSGSIHAKNYHSTANIINGASNHHHYVNNPGKVLKKVSSVAAAGKFSKKNILKSIGFEN